MESDQITYLELYRLKSGLLKQIKELDKLMEKAIPKDIGTLNRLVNNITLGVYDYPFNGGIKEKILFTLSQLKVATLSEMKRYMTIVGDLSIESNEREKEFKNTLINLEKAKMVIRRSSATSIDGSFYCVK